MPLYEYRCSACGHTFEKIQSFSAPDPEACPKCGGAPVERLLSAPAIQFKGSGFYLTDYGKTGGAKNNASETSGKSESSSPAPSSGSGDNGSSKPAPATPSSGSTGSSSTNPPNKN